MMRQSPTQLIYKSLAILLLLYGLVYGLMVDLPVTDQMLVQMGQSNRSLFYHVPNWFAMIVLMGISVYHSIRLLRLMDPDRAEKVSPLAIDIQARENAYIGVFFNIVGLATGIVWSRVTWNQEMHGLEFSAWWAWDPIQVCALISLLIYLAYFLLRSSIKDEEQRAKTAAVYNIFAFATLIPLFYIIPGKLEGLHPTAGKGSFIFDKSGIKAMTRYILYPTMFGFILLGVWLAELRVRAARLHLQWQNWQAAAEYEES